MSFPPPNRFMSLISAMAMMNQNQFQMAPMGGIMQVPMAVPGLSVPHMTTGISAPPGVATISAPPIHAVTGVVSTGPMNHKVSGLNSMSHINSSHSNSGHKQKSVSNGPSITVFVGNITERASDLLIRQLLSRCGTVNNWKRVQGANGKLQGFGFCEFADPESAMRAIRLLHDFEVADKKLVVKADAKTKEKLDNYLKEKNPSGSNSYDGDGPESIAADRELLYQLNGILREHEVELSRDPDPSKSSRRYDKRAGEPAKPENLADMDMEEEKRSLIHREIDKFRDTYKVDENDKKTSDKERGKSSSESRRRDDQNDSRSEDRYAREQSMEVDSGNRRERQRGEERTSSSKDSSRSRNRDRYDRNDRGDHRVDTNDRDRDRERERERERDRDRNRDRERERDRDRERERERERDRENKRERERLREEEDAHNERMAEDDEELQERRRLERKLREKEASYQKRLRNWEAREMRKQKEYKKYEMKQEARKEEEVKEIRKLKQFLEDYDDDRDDTKYYKGSSLARRLRDREKEKDDDIRDRQKEKRELEELRRKLADEGHPDPESEAQKRLNSSDVNREREKLVNNKIRELLGDVKSSSSSSVNNKLDDENSLSGISESTVARSEMHVKSFTFTGINKMGLGSKSMAHHNQNHHPALISPSGENSNPGSIGGEKRKKFSVQDVFNSNDDDDTLARNKKRKLPQLTDDNTDSNQSLTSGTTKSTTSGVPGENGVNKSTLTTEEKKKQVKSLIEKIPTTKDDLFKYTIDWSVVDQNLMEKRIRPWVNKKITEYIGEEEQALLDFICSKLQAKTSAQSILDDVAMVLDDEAEVFVVKMWRLLIYEIEAKKLGIGK